MRRGIIILGVAIAAGAVAFYAVRYHAWSHPHKGAGVAIDAMPELEWLRSDLRLTDEQFSKVRELHVAYRPKCVETCRRIAKAHEEMEALALEHKDLTPEFRVALKRHADLHLEGQEAMLKHLYETAALLEQSQAKRYLKAVLPFALDFSHSEPSHPQTH